MESYIQLTPLNNYLSNYVIKLRMKLLTPNLPLSNCVIELHMKLLTSNLPLGNCVIKLHQVTVAQRVLVHFQNTCMVKPKDRGILKIRDLGLQKCQM